MEEQRMRVKINEQVEGASVHPFPDSKLGVVCRNDGEWHVLFVVGDAALALPAELAREIGATLVQIANDLDAKRVGGTN